MGYIGQAPTKIPLTSADITDGTIALADMAANSIDSDQYVDGSIDAVHMSANSIDSDAYVDGSIDAVHLSANSVDSDAYVDASIDNAHLADDAVGVAELSATGTASSSTFLRGDNAWTAAGGGKLVQVVNVTNSTYASGTTLMPNDGTIPQITEGDEYMTLAITPTNSSNKLLIIWNFGIFASNGGQAKYSALFQDTTANALASVANQDGGANNQQNMTGFHFMAAGTTSSTTFKIRAGVNATDTFAFNGAAGGDRHSTAGASSITIFEIEV